MRLTIERRLSELAAEEAALDRQARSAMRFAGSDDAGVGGEAERVLGEISADRLALKTTREGLHVQLARLPVERSREAELGKLERLIFNAEAFAFGERLSDDGPRVCSGYFALSSTFFASLSLPRANE
jgi:hypothetical protein